MLFRSKLARNAHFLVAEEQVKPADNALKNNHKEQGDETSDAVDEMLGRQKQDPNPDQILEQRNVRLEATIVKLKAKIAELEQTNEERDYSQGYQLGLEAGREQAGREQQTIRESLVSVVEDLQAQGQRYLDQFEQVNVEVIFATLGKMIAASARDADYLTNLVREQVKILGAQSKVVVRVAPQDFQALFENDDINPGTTQIDHFQLVADDHIQLGGCIVETERGGLDARLEIQMQQFKDMLLDVYRRKRAGEI